MIPAAEMICEQSDYGHVRDYGVQWLGWENFCIGPYRVRIRRRFGEPKLDFDLLQPAAEKKAWQLFWRVLGAA